MAKAATYPTISADRSQSIAKQVAIVIGASLFIAACARVSVPLPFTPVYLTLANFAVLAVGITLGAKRGFAAAALYLAQGAMGLPVFAMGGGLMHMAGPTGGYLLAYPAVALVAGAIAARKQDSFSVKLLASLVAEVLLFACGISWLIAVWHVPAAQAVAFGLYPFIFGEIAKMMGAAGLGQKFTARLK